MSANDFVFPEDRYILIGKVVKPHGIRGELKIYSYAEQPENVLAYKQLVLVTSQGECSEAFTVKKCRVQGKMAVVSLESVSDRSHAEQLQGMGVLLEKDSLPPVGRGEYYWYEFLDLAVKTKEGCSLGIVKEIFSNGAQDVMVIGDDSQEYMIPIHETMILAHNDEGIIVNPPPGLLEINTGNEI